MNINFNALTTSAQLNVALVKFIKSEGNSTNSEEELSEFQKDIY